MVYVKRRTNSYCPKKQKKVDANGGVSYLAQDFV